MLKPFKRAFAGESQTGNVLLNSPIDVLQIDAQVVVHQDIPKPRQPFQSTNGCDILARSLSR